MVQHHEVKKTNVSVSPVACLVICPVKILVVSLEAEVAVAEVGLPPNNMITTFTTLKF